MEEEEEVQITSPNYDIIPSISSASSASQLVETEQTEVFIQQEDQQQPNNRLRWCWQLQPSLIFQRLNIFVTNFCSSDLTNDFWSCLIVILTFWVFATMVLFVGYYGSFNLQLGPNCSFLIKGNPFLVHSIQAHQVNDQTSGPVLYGFYESPLLDVETTWSRNLTTSIEPAFHKDWAYYLNAGSQIDVSYNVISPTSASLFLAIAQGKESLLEWTDSPAYPNTTMSWNIIYGSGKIAHDIKDTDTYFVAVANLNLETTEVYLNITAKSLLYNTSNAYFKCTLRKRVCSFKLIFFKPNAAVLTTRGPPKVETNDDYWYVQVSFGPQWIIYCGGSCIIAAIILALFKCSNQFPSSSSDEAANQGNDTMTDRQPLLSPKNNGLLSWSSSYDSIPSDEDDQGLEERMISERSLEGKVSKDGEIHSHNSRRLCSICFDAPRDCFFLPCGHCAACFSCGSRISEDAGTCPICRRKIRKVRKIFSV